LLEEPAPTQHAAARELDAMDQLKKRAELKGAGIVSEEEFEAKKKQLLAL
jgi:predicted Zn-dependent peptidase